MIIFWPFHFVAMVFVVIVLLWIWSKLLSFDKRLANLEYHVNPTSALKPTAPTLPAAGKLSIPVARLPRIGSTPLPAVSAPSSGVIDQWIIRAGQMIKGFFTKGNVVAKIGVIILFFGVAFMAKYAAQHNVFPVELRLILATLVAIILLSIGWRLREKNVHYALVLQGGGLAIFFLTVFIAYRLFNLIPALTTLMIMLLLTLSGVLLAILQNSRSLAVLAIVGGFMAPIMASSGHGSHVMLFSYYGILNIGILFIAWFKSWRLLNVLGFVFTFVIASLWGFYQYQPEYYLSNQLFLIFHIVFYVTVAILFAYRQTPRLLYYADGTLIFGVPIVATALQYGLVHNKPFGLALSALTAAIYYLCVAKLLTRFKNPHFKLLIEAFLVLGVVFATLALPLALDDRLAATIWALEGAGIVWLSIRQLSWVRRLFGVLLQLAAGILFIRVFPSNHDVMPILNAAFMGCAMLSFSGIISAYCLMQCDYNKKPWEEKLIPWVLFIWGCFWWYIGGYNQVLAYLHPVTLSPMWKFVFSNEISVKYYAMMLFVAASAIIACATMKRYHWDPMRYPMLLLLPVMLLTAVIEFYILHSVSLLSWLVAFVAWYVLLYQHDKNPREYLQKLHIITLLLLVWQVIIHCRYEIGLLLPYSVASGTWKSIVIGIIPSVFLLTMTMPARQRHWPINLHISAYVGYSGLILSSILLFWVLAANLTLTGDMAPLTYIPLLNPLDIVVLLAMLSVLYWLLVSNWQIHLNASEHYRQYFMIVLPLLAFVWANAMLLRSLHHWLNIAYQWQTMMDSLLVQMSLSIFWAILALVLTLLAARKHWRKLWFSGAALIILVALKLMLIDLISKGTIERVISFMVVGGLLLVIGYFAPLPPKEKKENTNE